MNPHKKIALVVVDNRTAPIKKEVYTSRKEHGKILGHIDISDLLDGGIFQNLSSVSIFGVFDSKAPLCPTNVSRFTIFVKMFLNLSHVDWKQSVLKLNECINAYNVIKPNQSKILRMLIF